MTNPRSGDYAPRRMRDRLERALAQDAGRVLPLSPGTARAAVAAVLDPGERLLFIKRSDRAGDPWSGHMAFPGGRVDPGDASPRAAAERETLEEVGLPLAQAGRLVGALDELASPVRAGPTRLVVSPFVYTLSQVPELRPNHEVASVHWIALERLALGDGRGGFELAWQGQRWWMPHVELDGVRIWGLTLRMLDDLLGRTGGVVSPDPRLLTG